MIYVRHNFDCPRKAGFSLVELVLVLAILSIMAATAMPRYSQASMRFRADAAAKRIVNDLALARSTALTTSKAQTVVFTTSTGSYSMAGVAGLDFKGASYSVNLTKGPYLASLTSVSFGGASSVTFDIYGIPSSSGTIVVKVGTLSKTIALDATSGKAAVQ